MTLKEIINLIAETYNQPGYAFEKIVLRILEKFFLDEDKEIITPARFEGTNFQSDALVTSGVANFDRPTVIEIRYFRSGVQSTILRPLLIQIASKSKNLHQTHSFIIVVPFSVKSATSISISKFINGRYPDFQFQVWDLDKISPIFNKYAEFVSDLIPQISNRALKNIVDKSLQIRDWKVDRERLIEKVRDALKKDDLTLFVGAGVSASAGLPDWSSLLSQLLVSLISKNLPNTIDVNDGEKLVIAKSLQQLNSSPLLEARYVNSGLGENFEDEVATVLYRDILTETTSELIKSIANLCIPPRGALGVRAIVNYNFDDLIEKQLEVLGLKYRPIYRDVDIPIKEELGIFHVHGFLPRETKEYEGISESLLVFSEKNYHTIMQEPYFWSNLIQLNFFRENTCLLIGLSGTDPNLRRLLEIAKRKTRFAKHYILLKRTPNSFFIENFTEQKIEYSNNLIEAINAIHHSLHEKSFDELGLNVIWYDEYSELPLILNKINER